MKLTKLLSAGLLVLIFIAVTMTVAQSPSMPVGQIIRAGVPGALNCYVGQHYYQTDAVAGKNMHICTALPNVWTQVGQTAAGVVTGAGTTNTLPKYTTGASAIIGDSAVTDDGTAVTITNRTLNSTIAGGNVPVWEKYALVAIANGVNTCANVNGCWQVNGVYNSIRTAGLTQSVVLGPLGAKGNVTDFRIKSAVVCTGTTTTANTGLGTTGTINLYRVENYSLIVAPGNGNMITGPPTGGGNDTHAATNLVASLVTTGTNVDTMAADCAVDYWVGRVVLP